MAAVLFEQDKCKEAHTLFVEIRKARRKDLGVNHRDTLISTANLATSYICQSKWKMAEQVLFAVIPRMEEVLGVEHTYTLSAMENLATAFPQQGQHEKAEQLQLRSADTRKRRFGEKHPETLTSMANLACTYSFQGRYADAEQMLLEVIRLSEPVLGNGHPSTLYCKAEMVHIYNCRGHYEKARRYGEPLKESVARFLGEDDAISLADKVLGKIQILGDKSLATLTDLARALYTMGWFDGARKVGERVLDAKIRRFGENHPDTILSMSDLALVYQKQGK